MKKYFILSVSGITLFAFFLGVGCQKEKVSTERPLVPAEENINPKAQAVSGGISVDHAKTMAETFSQKYPSVVTRSVGYSIDNLITYLNNLKSRQLTDSVYVYYGAYDKETAPKASYIGRNTIFFLGQKMSINSTGRKLKSINAQSNLPIDSTGGLNLGDLQP